MSFSALIDEYDRATTAEPARATVVFSTRGSLTGPTRVELTSRDHAIVVDEPPTLGGEDQGANPVEHALVALASCQAISYRFWAAKLGVELDSVEIEAEGDLDVRGFFGFDEEVRAGYTGVRLRVTPRGPESEQRYRELADAVDAHCPVLDLFRNPTPVARELLAPTAAAA